MSTRQLKDLSTEDEVEKLKQVNREQKATIDELRNIINNIPGDIYWKNCQGEYLGLNLKGSESLQKMGFSYGPSEIIGKTDYDIYDKNTAASYIENDRQVMQSGLESILEEAILLPSGEKLIQLSIKRPLFDEQGQIIGTIGNTINISYLKAIEVNLRKAKDEAEAASLAKTMFLANMSHDLKTPLAGIISTAECLSQSLTQTEDKTRANDIFQSGLRLLELLVEIIEVSRLDTNASPNHAAFSPKTLVKDLIQLLRPVILNKNISFKVYYQDTIPSTIIGDRWQLYRIILNLLGNAIKFTHEGSISLTILIDTNTENDLKLKIIVKDTGIGIPIDKQTIIFDEFTRLTHAYNEQYQGTGLGLFIVKKFIESMRGEISLTSTEGIGSTFTCLIPFKSVNLLNKALNYGPVSETLISIDDKPALKHPIIDDTKNFSDIKILLVEDNAIAARTTEAILHSLGCKIDIAKTGGEALMLLKNHHYSFIYMDLGLPDMSGMEVSKIFRAQEGARSPKTPIIALSAHSNEEIKASCLRAGMNESISKPLLREQAKKNIQHYLNANELICPPSSKENLSANLKVIDLDLGAAILGADHNAAKTTLAMIMEQLPESHRIITLAYLQKNTDQLIKATHQLHGGLLYGGAVRLEKATAALEAAARLDDATTLSGCYAQYCNEILYLNEAYGKI